MMVLFVLKLMKTSTDHFPRQQTSGEEQVQEPSGTLPPEVDCPADNASSH